VALSYDVALISEETYDVYYDDTGAHGTEQTEFTRMVAHVVAIDKLSVKQRGNDGVTW
jgi:hypothetical protein